ncbi:hypothetical protein P691DRAFT_663136, partial [Macrolepiota fuliginosa MF-IS2]
AFLNVAFAKVVVVTVGGNTTTNPRAVFDPPTVTARQGDVVYFNFTQGNHTVIQSVFAAPCMPAHDFNATFNGFDSGFRAAGNSQVVTNLQVPITDNSTIWYFDWNTCGAGGVGGVNVNDSSLETYDGFVRNALRLNGSEVDSTSTSSVASRTATASSAASTSSRPNSATRAVTRGTLGALPLLFGALALLF